MIGTKQTDRQGTASHSTPIIVPIGVTVPYRPFEKSAYSPGTFFSKKLQREKLHITSFSLQDSKLIDAFILN